MMFLHGLAVLFLVSAIALYLASWTTGAAVLGMSGFALEMLAWTVAMFTRDQPPPDDEDASR